jgi:uncharacterized coiled-coil protein SlyX
MALEDRVTELEVRVAYQDKVIAALDDVVRDFAARVTRLERLAREPTVAAAGELPDAPDEPPPHY